MSTILGPGLGKLKSLGCLHDPETTAARFTTVHTDPADLRNAKTQGTSLNALTKYA